MRSTRAERYESPNDAAKLARPQDERGGLCDGVACIEGVIDRGRKIDFEFEGTQERFATADARNGEVVRKKAAE